MPSPTRTRAMESDVSALIAEAAGDHYARCNQPDHAAACRYVARRLRERARCLRERAPRLDDRPPTAAKENDNG